MGFRNRRDAGLRLAARLMDYQPVRPVVLALPRGGVPVAAEAAAALDAPLEVIVVSRIGVPWQPDVAMGAVADGDAPLVVRNESVIYLAGVSRFDFHMACRDEAMDLERRRQGYLRNRAPADIAGRTVILVDDEVSTGETMRAALRATRKRGPRAIVVAVPLGSSDVIADLRREADAVVCLETHAHLGAVGQYYSDFRPVGDREVKAILTRFAARDADPRTAGRPTVRAWRAS